MGSFLTWDRLVWAEERLEELVMVIFLKLNKFLWICVADKVVAYPGY